MDFWRGGQEGVGLEGGGRGSSVAEWRRRRSRRLGRTMKREGRRVEGERDIEEESAEEET